MTRRQTALGVALCIAGVVVLWGFGGGLFATDEVASNVTIEPHPNNGQYVVATGSDEVAIDVTAANRNLSSGINDEATTRIDDVVLLTNDRGSTITVWTEDASDDVTFYRSTAGRKSIEGSGNGVSLSTGETLSVGFELDTYGSDSVAALQNVSFHVSDDGLTSSPGGGSSDPVVDDPPYLVVHHADADTLNATVRNIDGGDRFRIDSENAGQSPLVGAGAVGLDDVRFRAAREGDVSFNLSADRGLPGTLDRSEATFRAETGTDPLGSVTVTQRLPEDGADWIDSRIAVDADAGAPDDVRIYRVENGSLTLANATYEGTSGDEMAFTVRASESARYLVAVDRPSIYVSRAALNRTTVPVGGAVTVSATVVNDGPNDADYVADVFVDDRVTDSAALSVPARGNGSVTIQRRFDEAGTYAIRVESKLAGRLTVTNESGGVGLPPGSGPPSAVTPDTPTGPPEPSTRTPTPTSVPATPEPEETGILDIADVDGPAALALSGMLVFVVFGVLYYLRRRLRDDDEDGAADGDA